MNDADEVQVRSMSGSDDNAVESGHGSSNEKPILGMKFKDAVDAYSFYVAYGGINGFSVRRQYENKSKKDKTTVTSALYTCSKEGHRKPDKRDAIVKRARAETRTGCPARMGVGVLACGQYVCNIFVDDHNHPLHSPESSHLIRSQRKAAEAQAVELDVNSLAGIRSIDSSTLAATVAGGQDVVGYTHVDPMIFLRSKRQRDLVCGDAGTMLEYLESQCQENPSFVYGVQFDMYEQITNIFWADPKMKIDYEQFGDVVVFDTMFTMNREYRPLCVFVGFNHYWETVIFGAALLYDETARSFCWLFQKFLEVQNMKKPLTIFTDQDAAMEKAICEVLPKTRHGLCTWHLMQNGIKHLGNLMEDGSSFLHRFKKCMFHCNNVNDFEVEWATVRAEYGEGKSTWLDDVYVLREKWANCFMKDAFTLGIRSSQLSGSYNRILKGYVHRGLSVIDFFKQFERVVDKIRYQEIKSEFECREKLPRNCFPYHPLVTQVIDRYTPKVFDIFHHEYQLVGACFVKSCHEVELPCSYVIGMLGYEEEFQVLYDGCAGNVSCSCRKFESVGILCCHVLKLFERLDVRSIPEPYILKRWMRTARTIHMFEGVSVPAEGDKKLLKAKRYKELAWMAIKLVTLACETDEGFQVGCSNLENFAKNMERVKRPSQVENEGDGHQTSVTGQASGIFEKI